MKDRITSWPSTVLGLGLLAFFAFVVWKVPGVTEHPEKFVLLAGGLAAIVYKGTQSNG